MTSRRPSDRGPGRDVDVATGEIGGQALRLCLVDQVVMNVVPVVFGAGRPFFGAMDHAGRGHLFVELRRSTTAAATAHTTATTTETALSPLSPRPNSDSLTKIPTIKPSTAIPTVRISLTLLQLVHAYALPMVAFGRPAVVGPAPGSGLRSWA